MPVADTGGVRGGMTSEKLTNFFNIYKPYLAGVCAPLLNESIWFNIFDTLKVSSYQEIG